VTGGSAGPYGDYDTDALIAELRRQHDDYQPAEWAIVWEVIGRLLAEREILLQAERVVAADHALDDTIGTYEVDTPGGEP